DRRAVVAAHAPAGDPGAVRAPGPAASPADAVRVRPQARLMASWISVYCATSVARVGRVRLLAGIRGRDPDALAAVDYHTLAEDRGVDGDEVAAWLAQLRIDAGRRFDTYTLRYRRGDTARPVFVRRWVDPTVHVEEEIDRGVPSPAAAKRLRASVEAIGIELG